MHENVYTNALSTSSRYIFSFNFQLTRIHIRHENVRKSTIKKTFFFLILLTREREANSMAFGGEQNEH